MTPGVQGVPSLSRKFERMEVDGKTLKRALVAGALPVQNEIKRAAPVLSGNLRRSVHIGGEEDLAPDRQGIEQTTGQAVPEPEVGQSSATVYVGTDVEYAAAQEFGRPDVNLPAQPYMRPGFDTAKGEAVREVADALDELIKAAAR